MTQIASSTTAGKIFAAKASLHISIRSAALISTIAAAAATTTLTPDLMIQAPVLALSGEMSELSHEHLEEPPLSARLLPPPDNAPPEVLGGITKPAHTGSDQLVTASGCKGRRDAEMGPGNFRPKERRTMRGRPAHGIVTSSAQMYDANSAVASRLSLLGLGWPGQNGRTRLVRMHVRIDDNIVLSGGSESSSTPMPPLSEESGVTEQVLEREWSRAKPDPAPRIGDGQNKRGVAP
ncbi:hypothetical protein C8Q74DRAFT_1221393 [Fomes fomentarius]|nr:hypothetical protein C8Q74DRAFT_1221393 [Fomes fomentarius]